MKYSIYFFFFATLLIKINTKRLRSPRGGSTDGIEPSYFSQILDHFGNETPTYWNQLYYVNESLWGKTDNSPVFLMVGGEGGALPDWMTGGAWVTWAYKYQALLFQLEHRFYGSSHPTEDTSMEHLQYLSSYQAIGDIKYFITQMNSQYNLTSENKWILFGGSYSGNLAAWARLKLPDLVFGSVASSAPLQATVDFYQFIETVRASLEWWTPGCSEPVYSAVTSVQQMMNTSSGFETVNEKFSICSPFNSSNDKVLFYQSIVSPITNAVQANDIGSPTQEISYVCNYMTNNSISDPVDRLAALYVNVTAGSCIFDDFLGQVSYYQSTDWNSSAVNEDGRQWLYQSCHEFGYFFTSETKQSFFSDTVPLDFFTQQCCDIFGICNVEAMYEAANKTNQNYGGMDIEVERVIFVQGSIDPWHVLGMITHPTNETPLILIEGTTHCEDTLQPSSEDSPALTEGRKKIEGYLNNWLLQ